MDANVSQITIQPLDMDLVHLAQQVLFPLLDLQLVNVLSSIIVPMAIRDLFHAINVLKTQIHGYPIFTALATVVIVFILDLLEDSHLLVLAFVMLVTVVIMEEEVLVINVQSDLLHGSKLK